MLARPRFLQLEMRAGGRDSGGRGTHIQFLSMKITMKYFVPEYQVAGDLMIS